MMMDVFSFCLLGLSYVDGVLIIVGFDLGGVYVVFANTLLSFLFDIVDGWVVGFLNNWFLINTLRRHMFDNCKLFDICCGY